MLRTDAILPHLCSQRSLVRSPLVEDHVGLAPLLLPPPPLRQLSCGGGACAGGGACTAVSAPRRNLGTYFPGVGAGAAAAAAAAGATAAGSIGRDPPGRSEDLESPSVDLPSRDSRLILSFSSSSLSLCLCFSAISSSFTLRSASSFLLLSASVYPRKKGKHTKEMRTKVATICVDNVTNWS